MTPSPARISLPHFLENIFSTIVAPMLNRGTMCCQFYCSLGENADVKIAQQDNAAQMAKVIDALIALGIPPYCLKITPLGMR